MQDLENNVRRSSISSSLNDFQQASWCNGVYFPSLNEKLKDEKLETAYQRYSYRQRQKSLMLVNFADIIFKIILIIRILYFQSTSNSNEVSKWTHWTPLFPPTF